jgi:hypothetical protein
MRRVCGVLGVGLLVVALSLALAPYDRGSARCPPPLFGASGTSSGEPDPGLVLVIGPDCTDTSVRRLMVAVGLFVVGSPFVVAWNVLCWVRPPVVSPRTGGRDVRSARHQSRWRR